MGGGDERGDECSFGDPGAESEDGLRTGVRETGLPFDGPRGSLSDTIEGKARGELGRTIGGCIPLE